MTFDVYTPSRGFRIEDTVVFRTYTRRQVTDLINKAQDLELLETYDFSYDIDRPIKIDDATEDIVFVLRKK